MTGSGSQTISKRLLLSMLVIVFSLLLISVPFIFNSYQEYIKTNQSLKELKILQALAETANKISRERAPANKAMSSTATELAYNKQELLKYRQTVDAQISTTVSILKKEGFRSLAENFNNQTVKQLHLARKIVDQFADAPFKNKTATNMDQAILSMFSAWDSCFVFIKQFVNYSKGEDSQISNYYTLILILAEMRDQAGRIASHMIAPVTFKQPIPDENRERSIQSQKQTRYLWDLLNTLQPEKEKTSEFIQLH